MVGLVMLMVLVICCLRSGTVHPSYRSGVSVMLEPVLLIIEAPLVPVIFVIVEVVRLLLVMVVVVAVVSVCVVFVVVVVLF